MLICKPSPHCQHTLSRGKKSKEFGISSPFLALGQRGGNRPGSGRPRIGDERMDSYAVTLPQHMAAWLRLIGVLASYQLPGGPANL